MNQEKKSKPTAKEEPRIKLDSLLREGRLKTVDPDIGDVWEELHKINKQEEKAFNQKIEKVKTKFKKLKIKTSSVSKTKTAKKPSKTPKKSTIRLKTHLHKKRVRIALGFSVLLLGFIIVRSVVSRDKTDQLGAKTGTNSQMSSGDIDADIPEVDSTEFPLMWPSGKSEKDFKLVRVSPFGNDTVYTYIDSLNNQDIKISQQKLPERFKTDRDVKLKELADSFQATNVIQIDEQKVYLGYSESINTQSLIFIKKDLLIFIASPQQTSDEIWAGYITALQ